MIRIVLLGLALVSALPAAAQQWAFRDTDARLDRAQVRAATTGQTLVFYDDGQSRYSAGGSYSYTYAGGATAYGRYEIRQDGTVCIAFRNGFGRCDRYVRNAGRLILLTEKGERFPVRP
ncbi:MAG: hypothetical protein NXH82_09320 [Rhodobacteraceae bacterium]|nr:hypothetical protein [Paracoccaceae bacterium]